MHENEHEFDQSLVLSIIMMELASIPLKIFYKLQPLASRSKHYIVLSSPGQKIF